MATKNPSVKGARNERATARTLSLWYYDNPRVLIRRPAGGMTAAPDPAWVHLDDIWQIAAYDDPFPFVVQLKHYKDPLEVQHLFQPASRFRRAWEQCLVFYAEGKWPLLVYRVDRRPPLAVVHEDVALVLGLVGIPALVFEGPDEQLARVLPFEALLQQPAARVRQAMSASPG